MKYIASKLIYFVLFSIVLGIFIGHFFPEIALKQVMDNSWKANFLGHELKVGNTLSEWCSGVFISTMKLFINPIIFLTTALGVIQMGDVKKVGKLGAKALLYFEVVTTGALLIGIFVAWIIQPGKGVLRNISQANVSNYVNDAKGFTWVEMLSTNTTLQIIIGAILIGILVTKSKALSPLTGIMTKVSNTLFKWLFFLMLFAPLGAFGGMAYTIAKYGLGSIVLLAKLMATVYITMGLFIFVVLGLMLRQYKISIFKVLAYFKEELLIVLGTSSSEPVLPQLMVKLERMGCAKSVVGLVVPTGYSFNTDGSTIYMSMAVIFLAQVFEIHLSFDQIITIIGVLMVTSKGSAGVTGLGFIALASTLAAIKIIPIEGLALLLGVDRFMSEARAITNFTGNAVAAIWLANNENAFDRDAMNQALN
ncbi:MAG: cation:dicarboxylase symporter family transporter [Emticicia sp.]|nr:cation:dicarboxylase symporter family transporter [Emticicia sp.]